MKKLIMGLAVVAIFASCHKDKTDQDRNNVVLLQDTFRMYNNSVLTDKAQDAITYSAASPSKRAATATKNRTYTNNSNSSTGTTNAAETTVPKKKGWSHAAKGAVVGAGTGAVTGAIINSKNRAAGAVIGTVIGAASGYIIGKATDKNVANKKTNNTNNK